MSKFSNQMEELMQIKKSLYLDYEEKDAEINIEFNKYIEDEKKDTKFSSKLKNYENYSKNRTLCIVYFVGGLISLGLFFYILLAGSRTTDDDKLLFFILGAVGLILVFVSQYFWDKSNSATIELTEIIKYDFYKQKYEEISKNTTIDTETDVFEWSGMETKQYLHNKKTLQWQKWQETVETNLAKISSIRFSMWGSLFVFLLTVTISVLFLFLKTVNIGNESFSLGEIIFSGQPLINGKRLNEIFNSLKTINSFSTPIVIILILYVRFFIEYFIVKVSRNIVKAGKNFRTVMSVRIFEQRGIVDYSITTGYLTRAFKTIVYLLIFLVLLFFYGSAFLLQKEINNSDALTSYLFNANMSFNWTCIYIGLISSVFMFVSNIVYNNYCDKLTSIYTGLLIDF